MLAAVISGLRSPGFARDLQNWLQACLAHDNITTLAYFKGSPPTPLITQSRHPKVHENINDVYLTGAYLLDPFHDLHLRGAAAGVYRLSEIAPDQFHRNRYFLDYYRNTTMVDEIAFVCYPAPGVSVHLCLGRDSNSNRRFSAGDIATARRIAPIVLSLSESHWQNLAPGQEHAESDITQNLMAVMKRNLGIALSPRQAEVAMMILRGHSSVSAGLRLGISYQTVKVFRKQIYRKCGISSQAELFSLMLPMLGALSPPARNP
ncbi:MAG: helix-turn-helix transcriptional regulator [Halocynthiibacter sp.]